MKVIKTTNLKEINKILYNDEIWDKSSNDNSLNKEEYNLIDLCSEIYAAYNDKNDIFGIIYFNYNEDNEKIAHIALLKKYRNNKTSYEFAKEVLKTQNEDLYIVLAENQKNVIRFAKNFGFKILYSFDDNYIKNNIKYKSYKLKLKIKEV
jgi:hypothetical protein